MRTFRIYIILIVAVQLYGQSKKIVIDDIDTLTVNSYDEVTVKLDSLLYKSDNIGEYFSLSRINSDSCVI